MLQHPVRRQPLGAAVARTADLAPAASTLPPAAPAPRRASARSHLVAVPSVSSSVVEQPPRPPLRAADEHAPVGAPCGCPLHTPMTADPRPTLDDVVRQAARLRVVVLWVLGLALLGLLVLLMR